MLLGSHVPTADPLREAAARGADLVQVFLSAPKAWKPPLERDDAETLREADCPIYVHAPFLVNVATSNPRVRHPSRKSLQQTCQAAEAVGAAGVVVHGGHLPGGEDGAVGFANWRRTLERLESSVPVLIENTAGGTNAMSRTIDRIDGLWEAIDGVDTPVGFCLDTCHLWASGEDLLDGVARIQRIVGGIDLLHLNDSHDDAGTGRDRHANLGDGVIPAEDLIAVVKAAGAPVILETPGGPDEHAADYAWVRSRL